MEGFIYLHRQIFEWEWYNDANVFRVFIHLLLSANHKEKKWEGGVIKKGQVAIGRFKLAKELKLSEMQIRTALNKLKSTNEITIKSTNKNSIVTIVKYDKYQTYDKNITNKTTNNITNEQPTDNQRITTTNNDNNYLYNINSLKEEKNEIEFYKKQAGSNFLDRVAEQLKIEQIRKTDN